MQKLDPRECHKAWGVIVNFLDIPTLCTARLVSKKVCFGVSRHIKKIRFADAWSSSSLDAHRRDLPRVLKRFPSLEFVPLSLFLPSRHLIQVLLKRGVLGRVTHVEVLEHTCSEDVSLLCSHAELFTNLVGLSWCGERKLETGLLSSFPKLQELIIDTFDSIETYGAVFWLTTLTSLEMPLPQPGDAAFKYFSLVGASALTNLQKLMLECPPGCRRKLLAGIGQVKSLTELELHGSCPADNPLSLPWLTNLTSLRKLKLCGEADTPYWDSFVEFHASKQTLKTLGQMVWMADLDFPLAPGCDPGVLGSLTGLTRLSLRPLSDGECRLGSFNVGSLSELQYLNWVDYSSLTPASVSVLSSATKLTFLSFMFESNAWLLDLQLMSAVAGLTNLRSLEIYFNHDSPWAIECGAALWPLKGLTYLEWSGGGMSDADFRVVTRLTSLRVLRVSWTRNVTPAILSDLTVLTCLDHLRFWNTGIAAADITHGFRRKFNERRLDKGWPPIDIVVS